MSELEWYEKELTLHQAMNCIDENLRSSVRNFVAIGFYLKEIRNRKLYREDGCQNFEEFVRKHYDRDKGWASKCIKVNDQLSQGGSSPILAESYQSYKVYQLVELAYLTEEQRELASPDMTVKEIQAIRRPEPEVEVVMSQPEPEKPEERVISQQVESEEAAAVETPEQSRKERVQEQYRLQELFLYPFAKWLIKNHKEWFREDFQNRVEMVEQSERALKQYLGASRKGDQAYGFPVTSLTKVYARLYDDRIELTQFEGNEMTEVGTSEWFYLSAAVQAMWNEVALEEAQALRKRTEPKPETIIQEPVADEIVIDTNTCPSDTGSCRRQEWGTSLEEQKAGHKECVKCWEDWKKTQKVLNAANEQQEEKIPEPDESYRIGDLPQAKETYLKRLAQKLVERMGSKIVLDEMSSIPSEESIKKATRELDRMEAGSIELQEGVVAYASFDMIEFFQGEEDLGVCSYTRFTTQARKALSEWAGQEAVREIESHQEEELTEPEESKLTDLQIAQKELERAQDLLSKCLKDLPDEKDVHIRGMKIKVAALASLVCDMDNIENPAPASVQPELPLLKNNDQRAAFVDSYETWPLWIETVQTGERYYRYDLEDGISMVIKVYHAKLFDYGRIDLPWKERYTEGYGYQEYYLLQPGKLFRDCETNRSTLIDKLKEIQKAKK